MKIPITISPGEFLDRYPILELKQQYVEDPDALRRVNDELADLLTAWINCGGFTMNPTSFENYDKLKETNRSLWVAEDQVRLFAAAKNFGPGFVSAARQIYRLNDQRSQLKRELNEQLGGAVEVKQHPVY